MAVIVTAVIHQFSEDNMMLPSINYQNPKTPLESAMVTTLQELEIRGYSDGSLSCYSRIFRHLLRIAKRKGVREFSTELSTQFLKEYQTAGISGKICSKTRMEDALRGMRMLSSLVFTGACPLILHSKHPPVLPNSLAGELNNFLHYWEHERDVSWKTLECGKWALSQFILFAHQKGIRSWSDIKPELFTKFFETKTNLSQRSLKLMSTVLRVFLRYQFINGTMKRDWSYHVPQYRGFNNQRIPAIWSDEAIKSLLAAVDRNRPKGKRDYAILLLACRLGMRAGDIRNLQIENLNWCDGRIEFNQGKSGRKMIMPLTEEIGLALIDYLKNARPLTGYRDVFLRIQAPYIPLSPSNNLRDIITKYRELAGIMLPHQATGMHSLRHTLASRLLKAGNPLESITDILGHASIDTTRIYTRIDVEQLRSVALDPEESIHA